MLCSCLCTSWSAKLRLAEKVNSSDFPSSHCQRMLHQRQDCCSAAVVHSMVSQASTRGEGEQQRLPKLSLSENVAPETGLLLCSCFCTPWSAKPRLAEKVSSATSQALAVRECCTRDRTVAMQLFLHPMVSQASIRGEGEQQRLPKLSLSENVAPETGLLLCSCLCTPWSAKPRLAEKVSSSDFPSSHCQRMLHQRQDCCSAAVCALHGQPSLDSRRR